MTPHQCPVCNAELPDEPAQKHCPTCGWYLEPLSIPMTNAMAQFLASREEIQIAWARDMWQKGQLKAELNGINRDMRVMVKQLTRGYKERSQLYAQLLQLRELVETQTVALLDNGTLQEEEVAEDTAAPASADPAIAEDPPPATQLPPSSPAHRELITAVQQLQGQMQQQWEFLQTQLPAVSASLATPLANPLSPPQPQ